MKINTEAQRILKSIGAHFYAQLVTVASQFVLLPIFLSYMSVEKFGVWITISAVPMYLSLADVGILSATSNKMTMQAGQGDFSGHQDTFQSTLGIILYIFPIMTVVGLLVAVPAGWGQLQREGAIASIFLVFWAILNVFGGLFDAVYRSKGEYAKVTFLLTTGRVFDLLGVAAGIVFFKSLSAAALLQMLVRVAYTAIMYFLSKKLNQNLIWSPKIKSWDESKYLISNGYGFLISNISGLIVLQGTLLLVGWMYGAVAVAIYSVHRTITRIILQISALISKSIAPEVSRLHGEGLHKKLKKLCNAAQIKTIWLTVGFALILIFSGGHILNLWSKGRIAYHGELFYLLIIAAAISSLWQIPSTELYSINGHGKMANFMLINSLTMVLYSVIFLKIYGLNGMAYGLIFYEITQYIYVRAATK